MEKQLFLSNSPSLENNAVFTMFLKRQFLIG